MKRELFIFGIVFLLVISVFVIGAGCEREQEQQEQQIQNQSSQNQSNQSQQLYKIENFSDEELLALVTVADLEQVGFDVNDFVLGQVLRYKAWDMPFFYYELTNSDLQQGTKEWHQFKIFVSDLGTEKNPMYDPCGRVALNIEQLGGEVKQLDKGCVLGVATELKTLRPDKLPYVSLYMELGEFYIRVEILREWEENEEELEEDSNRMENLYGILNAKPI